MKSFIDFVIVKEDVQQNLDYSSPEFAAFATSIKNGLKGNEQLPSSYPLNWSLSKRKQFEDEFIQKNGFSILGPKTKSFSHPDFESFSDRINHGINGGEVPTYPSNWNSKTRKKFEKEFYNKHGFSAVAAKPQQQLFPWADSN